MIQILLNRPMAQYDWTMSLRNDFEVDEVRKEDRIFIYFEVIEVKYFLPDRFAVSGFQSQLHTG